MYKLDLIKSLMFSGFPIGILLLALLAGHIGKKKLMLINMIMALIGIILVVITPSLLLGGVAMFCCLFGLNINVNICYPFIAETVNS